MGRRPVVTWCLLQLCTRQLIPMLALLRRPGGPRLLAGDYASARPVDAGRLSQETTWRVRLTRLRDTGHRVETQSPTREADGVHHLWQNLAGSAAATRIR